MGSRSMKNRPSAKKKHPVTGVAAVFTVLGVLIVSLCVGALAVCASWLQDLEYRETIEFSQMSPYVLKGTVATEDERFYDHGGIDIAGIARAVVNNLTGGALEGASTITQQLVRNTVLADEMDDISIKRKVREAYVATKLEEQYSKDEILAMYLNTINYGSGAYGIEAASQRYFSKSCMKLTLPEAALLIGIPQSPTYNDPINYPDNALKRRNVVLDRMLSNGYITQTEHDQAVAEPINLNVHSNPDDGILAYPYLTSPRVMVRAAGLAVRHSRSSHWSPHSIRRSTRRATSIARRLQPSTATLFRTTTTSIMVLVPSRALLLYPRTPASFA